MTAPLKYGIHGTVTPASKEKLDREIAELTATGEKPEKLKAMIALRATMEPKGADHRDESAL